MCMDTVHARALSLPLSRARALSQMWFWLSLFILQNLVSCEVDVDGWHCVVGWVSCTVGLVYSRAASETQAGDYQEN